MSGMEQAHKLASAFRRDLRSGQEAGRATPHLLDAAGTLVSDLERLGADALLLETGRGLANEALKLKLR